MRNQEQTTLGDDQVLNHHRRAECSGQCCLHGSSPYAGCRFPTSWFRPPHNNDASLHHTCPCNIPHPCMAGLWFRHHRHLEIPHNCCGVEGHCGVLNGEVVPERPSLPSRAAMAAEEMQVRQRELREGRRRVLDEDELKRITDAFAQRDAENQERDAAIAGIQEWMAAMEKRQAKLDEDLAIVQARQEEDASRLKVTLTVAWMAVFAFGLTALLLIIN